MDVLFIKFYVKFSVKRQLDFTETEHALGIEIAIGSLSFELKTVGFLHDSKSG